MKTEKILLLGFALSNISALIYEVTWSRELTYVFGTSVHAISTVLTSFMSGLALGSYIFGKRADATPNPVKLFAKLEIGIGIYGLLTLGLFGLLTYPYFILHNTFHASFLFHYAQFWLAFLALIIPTTFIGATFPVMSKLYARELDDVGAKVGVVYSADTIGAAAGAFAAGFILIPFFGHNDTIILAAVINILVGAFIYNLPFESTPKKARRKRGRKKE
jgi:spermidine synthase